jgi:hypothetical protein
MACKCIAKLNAPAGSPNHYFTSASQSLVLSPVRLNCQKRRGEDSEWLTAVQIVIQPRNLMQFSVKDSYLSRARFQIA